MESRQTSDMRFALLIDADNVSSRYISSILDELSKYGTVTVKRIYGDWTLSLHSKWKDALLENSITPIQQFGYTQGKNATDSAMIIDAMDLLYGGGLDGFCIVSSDSDFTRLASRLRESGLMVIGMGEKKTPTPFRRACDVFTSLELLGGDATDGGMSKEDVEQAVVDIVTENLNNGKATGLGEVGSRMLKRYPDFDVRSYGTNLLSKLLEEFTRVIVKKDHSNVTVELVENPEIVISHGDSATSSNGMNGANGTTGSSGSNGNDSTSSQNGEDGKGKRNGRKRRSRKVLTGALREASDAEDSESIPEEEHSDASKTAQPTEHKEAKAADEHKNAKVQKIENYIENLISKAGNDGIVLAQLGLDLRAHFKGFKVRDLGVSQMRQYIIKHPEFEVFHDGKTIKVRMSDQASGHAENHGNHAEKAS